MPLCDLFRSEPAYLRGLKFCADVDPSRKTRHVMSFAKPNQGGKDFIMMNTVNGVAGANGVNGAVAVNGAVVGVGTNRAVAAGLVALSGGVGVLEVPKPYVEMPKVAETVQAVKEYSAEVLANAHITLRELKEKIASTVEVKLPSFKQLIAMNSPIVAVKEVKGAILKVYENGFASYEDHGAHTVIAGFVNIT